MWHVPASITLAQAILESAWGQSKLARECNNYFGVKAAHDAAPNTYQDFLTTEFACGHRTSETAAFAKYADVAVSFAAHARLLAGAPRYQPAMAAASNPEQFAQRLQACGYSTNPQYASDLMQLVRLYDLTQYDVEPEPPAKANELAA
jgi:flagellar protein FlgJ